MPKAIQHYDILEKIGEGGMGVVYKALHRTLERPVAIKRLGAHLSRNQAMLERFLKEARLQASLSHPNVVNIFDLLEWEGETFLVMEYVSGRSVRDIIVEDGRIPPAPALYIAEGVLSGLVFMHANSIVHRDIKPSNIIVSRTGQVKVTDFGIARLMEDDSGLTRFGAGVGTLQYMAPELLKSGEVSLSVDLYSMGVTLHEMLSGTPPFTGATDLEVMLGHIDKAPPPLDLPDDDAGLALAHMVRTALAKAPAERFATAQDFLDEVRRVRALLPDGGAFQPSAAHGSAAGPATADGLTRADRGAVTPSAIGDAAAPSSAPLANRAGQAPPIGTKGPAGADDPAPGAASGPGFTTSTGDAPTRYGQDPAGPAPQEPAPADAASLAQQPAKDALPLSARQADADLADAVLTDAPSPLAAPPETPQIAPQAPPSADPAGPPATAQPTSSATGQVASDNPAAQAEPAATPARQSPDPSTPAGREPGRKSPGKGLVLAAAVAVLAVGGFFALSGDKASKAPAPDAPGQVSSTRPEASAEPSAKAPEASAAQGASQPSPQRNVQPAAQPDTVTRPAAPQSDAAVRPAEPSPQAGPATAPPADATAKSAGPSAATQVGPAATPRADAAAKPTEQPAANPAQEQARPASQGQLPEQAQAQSPPQAPANGQPAESGGEGASPLDAAVPANGSEAQGAKAQAGVLYTKPQVMRLRGAPDAAAPILGALERNTRLDVLAIQDGWAKVTTPTRITGYVASDQLSETPLEPLPAPAQTPAPALPATSKAQAKPQPKKTPGGDTGWRIVK